MPLTRNMRAILAAGLLGASPTGVIGQNVKGSTSAEVHEYDDDLLAPLISEKRQDIKRSMPANDDELLAPPMPRKSPRNLQEFADEVLDTGKMQKISRNAHMGNGSFVIPNVDIDYSRKFSVKGTPDIHYFPEEGAVRVLDDRGQKLDEYKGIHVHFIQRDGKLKATVGKENPAHEDIRQLLQDVFNKCPKHQLENFAAAQAKQVAIIKQEIAQTWREAAQSRGSEYLKALNNPLSAEAHQFAAAMQNARAIPSAAHGGMTTKVAFLVDIMVPSGSVTEQASLPPQEKALCVVDMLSGNVTLMNSKGVPYAVQHNDASYRQDAQGNTIATSFTNTAILKAVAKSMTQEGKPTAQDPLLRLRAEETHTLVIDRGGARETYGYAEAGGKISMEPIGPEAKVFTLNRAGLKATTYTFDSGKPEASEPETMKGSNTADRLKSFSAFMKEESGAPAVSNSQRRMQASTSMS